MNHKGDKEYWQLVWNNFKAGDRQAFETIYNEFIDVLFAYGSKITSNKALLEDAIQDVFIDVYTYGKSLKKPELLEFYLFKVLRRNLYRKLKENGRFFHSGANQNQFDITFPIEDVNADKQQLEKQYQLLQKEIKSLDAGKRELLFLKFHSGLTYVEIGRLLNIKPDTAKKQVFRILKHFRKHFNRKLIELFLMCYKT